MNRTEIKSFLPILQAFADGKEIECREEDKWYKVLEICNEMNPQDYRIKPEPKYRPFANAKECWQEMTKHQPFGWIKDKKDERYSLITSICSDVKEVYTDVISGLSLYDFSSYYTFADGTPFGILEEE